MENNCCNCNLWKSFMAYILKDKGECRRNAPTLNSDNETVWPITCANDFCGEFTLKKD